MCIFRDFEDGGPRQITVAARVGRIKGKAWKRLSAGEGAKGPRLYDWAAVLLKRYEQSGWSKWILARRRIVDRTDVAYYMVFGPEGTTLAEMVRVAGTRWMIEETIETAKGEVGLDRYEVRRWNSWYRHIALAMLAHAFLTVTRAKVVAHSEKGAA